MYRKCSFEKSLKYFIISLFSLRIVKMNIEICSEFEADSTDLKYVQPLAVFQLITWLQNSPTKQLRGNYFLRYIISTLKSFSLRDSFSTKIICKQPRRLIFESETELVN